MARLGQHADVVASVRAEQAAAENPIQLDVAADGSAEPPVGDDALDPPPHDAPTLH